ncbi:MAG: M15 family metallopeptidase [Beijerinckiaceae bacterium]
MCAFYGDPDINRDGRAGAAWIRAKLVRVRPPYRMRWSWGGDVEYLTVHKACAPSLLRILSRVAKVFGSQGAIEEAGMHLCGGAFDFRPERGGASLSAHAWGAAIDLDPEGNRIGRAWAPHRGMVHESVIDAFEEEGWRWGGRWRRPDAMHFEAAYAPEDLAPSKRAATRQQADACREENVR